jgi:hypothetical protein
MALDVNDVFVFIERSTVPLVILLFGLVGNIIGFAVFSRRSLFKFPTRNIYRSLAVFDTIFLTYRMIGEITTINNISIYLISNMWCKIFRYLRYAMGPISAWILVYISIGILLAYYVKGIIRKIGK